MEKWKVLDEETEPLEMLLCPFCGARLNRVGKHNILPTSCHECSHERFEPKSLRVSEVILKTK